MFTSTWSSPSLLQKFACEDQIWLHFLWIERFIYRTKIFKYACGLIYVKNLFTSIFLRYTPNTKGAPPHRFTWRRYRPFFRSWKRESPFHVTWIREMRILRETGKVVFFCVISWKHRFLVCISSKIWTILTV